jgi:hypothetical protein
MSGEPAVRRSKRGGDWNGNRPAWSREPFEPGNRAAVRHGVYLQNFNDAERDEIEEIADSLRAAAPLYSAAFEPTIRMTAARIWRWRRAYAYLSERGEDASRALLRDLNVLERSLQRDLADLGVNPRAAAELGVNLARLAAASGEDEPDFDWNALDPGERRTLSALLAKGSADA